MQVTIKLLEVSLPAKKNVVHSSIINLILSLNKSSVSNIEMRSPFSYSDGSVLAFSTFYWIILSIMFLAAFIFSLSSPSPGKIRNLMNTGNNYGRTANDLVRSCLKIVSKISPSFLYLICPYTLKGYNSSDTSTPKAQFNMILTSSYSIALTISNSLPVYAYSLVH